MEVKTYKKIRNNLYEITLSNGEKFKLYDDIILKYELLIERKVTDKKLASIIAENAKMEAYYKALRYVSTKMRSEIEIRKYLNKNDTPQAAKEYAIDKLKKDGYLNQEKYAQAFVNDAINLSNDGPHKIREDLERQGIDKNIVENYLNVIEDEVWKARVEKVLLKKAKTNKVGYVLFKNKMYNELVMLGYDSSMIGQILDGFSLDTDSVFSKEATKVYEKLSSKYQGTELELRFRSRMYAKGFSGDQISKFLSTL